MNRYTEDHKATQLHEFGVLEANSIHNFITFKNCYQWATEGSKSPKKSTSFNVGNLNRFSPQDLPLNNHTHKGVSNEQAT